MDRLLSRADDLLDRGRALAAVDMVTKWALSPERRAVRDAEVEAAVAKALAWVATSAPGHRDRIAAELLVEQQKLAAAVRSGLVPVEVARLEPSFEGISTAKARADAVDRVAAKLQGAPLRARAEATVARLERVHATWRRLVAALGNGSIVPTWHEFRGLPTIDPASKAYIAAAAPPTADRITFDCDGPAGKERVALRWSELGVRLLAQQFLIPFTDTMEPAFRLDLAEMLVEAGHADAAATLLAQEPTASARRDELLRDVAAMRMYAGGAATADGVSAARKTYAALRYKSDPAAPGSLCLTDEEFASILSPK